ncbi:hypothetical protein CLAFUW4_10781 [Fulvia fulva]|uniref:Uncharacterized protein n=1 Tax=Passalora fulva TaxID=5499 RepID=A0A9Q8PCC6_PASFU|nr:uncharacterized protein CLAFUR5_09824 [Fulvia fulva]KAK4619919.1 hypothetical protein CLAFUR4_10786 [Fulvia fulva]KAK4620606.1 hypothetical protein CLAFUR0_10793 [Fulvia fulva]UJO19850.1 hypothetical protein CLAFUR5_09824 [Fulvia fulva]WPV17618.1 hypothetical protein CLAFUW4_10781 [Fulvia fulva]WPV32199.1 hypothetical protein CLAFUW7_10779 [Fulvia fulva]
MVVWRIKENPSPQHNIAGIPVDGVPAFFANNLAKLGVSPMTPRPAADEFSEKVKMGWVDVPPHDPEKAS